MPAQKTEDNSLALQGAVKFFQDNVGSEVMFWIANNPHHVRVISVNEDELKLNYHEIGMPRPFEMEIKYIDDYRAGPP